MLSISIRSGTVQYTENKYAVGTLLHNFSRINIVRLFLEPEYDAHLQG